MRQIILNIDCGEMDCGKCTMQMEWYSADKRYVDCVLDGEKVAEGKGVRGARTVACRLAEARLALLKETPFLEAVGKVDKGEALRIFGQVFDEAIKAEWDWEFNEDEKKVVAQVRTLLSALPDKPEGGGE